MAKSEWYNAIHFYPTNDHARIFFARRWNIDSSDAYKSWSYKINI